MKTKYIIYLLLTVLVIAGISYTLLLMASGYRFDFNSRSIQPTGIISVSSTPDGGLVYINGVPKDASNTSITDLKPGNYSVSIEKEGFHTWEKETAVKKELVTKINALLVPLFPSLRPLTFTGVTSPIVSPDRQKAVYTVEKASLAGIWLVEFDELPFNITKKPRQLIENTEEIDYTKSQLTWSPDSNTLLIEHGNGSETYDFINNTLEENVTPIDTKDSWEDQETLAYEEKLLNLTDNAIESIKTFNSPTWSPNDSFILHTTENETNIEYYVYEIPPNVTTEAATPTPTELNPIGKEPVLSIDKSQQHLVKWFSDSKHLLYSYDNNGQTTLEIIEIDGNNQTQIFTGRIKDFQIFPNPAGTKIIVLTSFNSLENESYNLYSLSLQ